MSLIGMFVNLAEDDPEVQGRINALRSGLPDDDVEIIPTYGAGKLETYQRKADDLVALRPDVLFAACGPTLWALQVATRTIPIVFAGVIDPVATGVLMGDGGKITGYFSDNVTGFISYGFDLGVQMIKTLHKIAPEVTRLAVIWDPGLRAGMGQLGALVTAAQQAKIPLTRIDLREADDVIADAVAAFAKTPNGGLIVPGGTSTATRRQLIINLAAQYSLPAVYTNSLYIRSAGLISYGADTLDLYKQAGGYIGQILNGKKPCELPIVPNCNFQICINQSTADALRLKVPLDLGTVIQ